MGTHPIFESDFDCLTDQKSIIEKMGEKSKKPKTEKKAKKKSFWGKCCNCCSKKSVAVVEPKPAKKPEPKPVEPPLQPKMESDDEPMVPPPNHQNQQKTTRHSMKQLLLKKKRFRFERSQKYPSHRYAKALKIKHSKRNQSRQVLSRLQKWNQHQNRKNQNL